MAHGMARGMVQKKGGWYAGGCAKKGRWYAASMGNTGAYHSKADARHAIDPFHHARNVAFVHERGDETHINRLRSTAQHQR